MIAVNIFRLIGDFFKWLFSISFDLLRLNDLSWWASNGVNWIFMIIFLFLLRYWMKESYKFKREGTEDKA
jgi:hypothetical protein